MWGSSSKISLSIVDSPTFYKILSKIILTADRYYCISRFPSICYTDTLSSAMSRDGFSKLLREICLTKKRPKVTYLSILNIQGPFSKAMSIYKNVDRAYKECMLMIETLGENIENMGNLEIRYLEQPPEWYIQFVFPEDVFLIIRTPNREALKVLQIRSKDVGEYAYSIFKEKISYSERVTSDNIDCYIERMKKDLKIVADYRNKKIMREKSYLE
ncbi:hypothetical protein H0N98_02345 [Candidatus Micrarchaeota archaeon]|nr:hypothetical protein [Candidatus Micrarchaeota archaeon]